MKKLTSLLACVVGLATLLSMLAPQPVRAQTAPATVRITPATLEIGESQVETVTILLENVTGAYGIDLRGKFDPNVVEIVAADAKNPLKAGGFIKPDFVAINKVDNTLGTFQWVATQVNPTEEVSGSGPVVVVQFRGKGARGQVSKIELTTVQLASRKGEELPVSLQTGTVAIVAPKAGQAIVAASTPAPALALTRAPVPLVTDAPTQVPPVVVASVVPGAATATAVAQVPTLAPASTAAATKPVTAVSTAVPPTAVPPAAPAGGTDQTLLIVGGFALIAALAAVLIARSRANGGR